MPAEAGPCEAEQQEREATVEFREARRRHPGVDRRSVRYSQAMDWTAAATTPLAATAATWVWVSWAESSFPGQDSGRREDPKCGRVSRVEVARRPESVVTAQRSVGPAASASWRGAGAQAGSVDLMGWTSKVRSEELVEMRPGDASEWSGGRFFRRGF